MGDGFVGQGLPDDSDLPDSPGGGEGEPADDDAADDVSNSQADDGAEDADDGEGEGDDSDAEDDGTGDEGTSPTFDKLLKKYGGDHEALARAYLQQANSMSDMDGRLKSLEQFVRGQQKPTVPEVSPEEMKQRIAESPDVVDASEELASIEADITSEQEDYRNAIKEIGDREKEVARLEGKLEAAYDEMKPQIESQLAAARGEHQRALSSFKAADRNLRKLRSTFEKTKRRMAKAEQSAKAEIDREQKQRREDDKAAQETREEFFRAMISEAKDRNIPTDSKDFRIRFDSVQSRLWAYTQTLPEDADPINIPAAVKMLMSEYDEMGGGSFQARSREKRRAAGRKGGKPASDSSDRSTPKGGKEPIRDSAWWDRRAKRMLGG